MPDKELRLLALDGGGVRGLSALIILGQLMEMVNPDSPPKPCDYFDMIGGTSTGGLIAVMLGRLKMSTDECIDAYLSLSDRVFQKKRHRMTTKGNIQGRFDSEELAQAVKEVVTRKGLEEDALLKDASDEACKVFVCATSKQTRETVCLRSYKSSRGFSDLLDSVKIWEACRATSAASSFFDPITVGRYGEEFVDGATGANNPVWEVWNEAQLMWGPGPLESRIKCLVSIGTGVPSLKPFQDDVFCIGKTLVAIATETEQTAQRFRRDKSHLDNTGRYYRFNACGLEDIGLEETVKKKEIAAATRRYVQAQEVFKQMQACADDVGVIECFGEYQKIYSTDGVLRACDPMIRPVQINNGDPLSISASVAGLIALSGQIYSILSRFISNVEDAPQSARSAIAAVEQMRVVLFSVQKLIINRSSVSYERKALIQLDDLIITLTESVITLSDLKSHISPFAVDSETTLGEWNRLRSNWQEGKVSHYIQRIESHKMSITIMLDILQSESDEKARSSQAQLQSMIEQVMVQNQDMVARLKRLENTFDATLPAASILEDSQSTIRAPSHRGDNGLSRESVVSNEIKIDQIRRWSFEGVLQGTRVYRRMEGNDTDVSFTTSIRRPHAWSIFSGLSLADISELSVIALPLFYEDLTDGISFHDSEPQAYHLRDPDLQATQEASTTYNSEGTMPQALSRKLSSGRTPQLGMDYRRTSLAATQQQKASFNSRVYARFAGPSHTQNTNGILPKAPNMLWDNERIEVAVTRQFVLSNLGPDGQVRLDQPIRFGDNLTNNTYMEWIDLKTKRIFLILVDLGVPDRIFGVIDDSWDDNDLPVPLDQVHRLQLTYNKDKKLESKFFHYQFRYLSRTIQKGDTLHYDEQEIVPLGLAERKAIGQVAGLAQSNVDQVHLPGRADEIFIRRRIPLGIVPGRMPQGEFLSRVEAMRAINHNHLVSLWASYIHQDCGYLLLTPVNDSTLKSFLTVPPQSVKLLAGLDRRILLLNWLHCLADALFFLHDRGLSHRNIRPSNVMLNQDNHIFLGDAEIFSTNSFAGDKRGFDIEAYNYAAPEQAPRYPTQARVLLPVSRPLALRRGDSMNSFLYQSTQSISKRNIQSKPNPQKSDIFSLGTIFLEILTSFMKRSSKDFASHRSARNKTAGQGGGPPDASFHKNLGQIEGWMCSLARDAAKKEDGIFRGVRHILHLVERMLAVDPDERHNARYVQERLGFIFTEVCGLGNQGTTPAGENIPSKGRLHCDARRTDENEWDFGFEELGRSRSQEGDQNPMTKIWPAPVYAELSFD